MSKLSVVLYNKLKPELYDDFVYKLDQFRNELNILINEGYQSISCSQLIEHIHGKKKLPEKSILLTFDGGFAVNFQFARRVLKKMGFKATFFIAGEWILKSTCEEPGYSTEFMNMDQVRELQRDGFELALHGYSQVNFNTSIDSIKAEIEKNISFFKKFELSFPMALAYSFSFKIGQPSRRRELFHLFKQLGIEIAFNEGNKIYYLSTMKAFDIKRIEMGSYNADKEFVRKIRKGSWKPKMSS